MLVNYCFCPDIQVTVDGVRDMFTNERPNIHIVELEHI